MYINSHRIGFFAFVSGFILFAWYNIKEQSLLDQLITELALSDFERQIFANIDWLKLYLIGLNLSGALNNENSENVYFYFFFPKA